MHDKQCYSSAATACACSHRVLLRMQHNVILLFSYRAIDVMRQRPEPVAAMASSVLQWLDAALSICGALATGVIDAWNRSWRWHSVLQPCAPTIGLRFAAMPRPGKAQPRQASVMTHTSLKNETSQRYRLSIYRCGGSVRAPKGRRLSSGHQSTVKAQAL